MDTRNLYNIDESQLSVENVTEDTIQHTVNNIVYLTHVKSIHINGFGLFMFMNNICDQPLLCWSNNYEKLLDNTAVSLFNQKGDIKCTHSVLTKIYANHNVFTNESIVNTLKEFFKYMQNDDSEPWVMRD